LRESVRDAALVEEALGERRDDRRVFRLVDLEALDRDGLAQAQVLALVDDREAALADHLVHVKLPVDHVARETEDVR